MRIAVVVYDGVLSSECEAFRSVLGLMRDAEQLTVGAHGGTYAGPGGIQTVDAKFDEIDHADVVIVPGGLGCERAADDPELRAFLHRMERSARVVAASSTGSVVLASAGLLHGEPAATHWLATSLLRRYGSEADERRLVIQGKVITCEGQISAVDGAFAIVERLEGAAAVERIRATLIERGAPWLREPNVWNRFRGWFRTIVGASTPGDVQTTAPSERFDPASPRPPVTPLSVMIELVDNDDVARRMKRSARGRSNG